MTCDRWAPLLSAYLDEELSPMDRDLFSHHLDSCEHCREEIASLRRISELLSVDTKPDPFFVTRFRARRDEELGTVVGWLDWRRLAVRLMPLAALTLLCAGAAVWLSNGDEGLIDLEARELGNGLAAVLESTAPDDPILQIVVDPFPGEQP